MRVVSAALVLLSGVLMLATATAATLPESRSMGMAIGGTVVGLIGLIAWVIAFLGDRNRA
jgi:hypothetical protein